MSTRLLDGEVCDSAEAGAPSTATINQAKRRAKRTFATGERFSWRLPNLTHRMSQLYVGIALKSRSQLRLHAIHQGANGRERLGLRDGLLEASPDGRPIGLVQADMLIDERVRDAQQPVLDGALEHRPRRRGLGRAGDRDTRIGTACAGRRS